MNKPSLNQKFATACANGELDIVIDMYNQFYLNKSKFFKFLGIFNINSVLNLHYDNDTPIINACIGGHYDIIEFLLADGNFIKTIKNNKLATGLNIAMGAGNLKIAQKFLPLLKENNSSYYPIYNGFVQACREGHLNIVEYITTQSVFNIEKFDLNNDGYSFYSMNYKGFIDACSFSQVDIVKYLTSSPKIKNHVKLDNIKTTVKIDNIEIMRHFIFALDLKLNDSFAMRINKSFELANATLDMLDKKNLYKEITKDFNCSASELNNKTIKRIKL